MLACCLSTTPRQLLNLKLPAQAQAAAPATVPAPAPTPAQSRQPATPTQAQAKRPRAAAFNYSHIIEARRAAQGEAGEDAVLPPLSHLCACMCVCAARSAYCFVHVKLLTRARHFEMFMRFHDRDEQLINPTRNYEYANVPAKKQTGRRRDRQTDRQADVQAEQRAANRHHPLLSTMVSSQRGEWRSVCTWLLYVIYWILEQAIKIL